MPRFAPSRLSDDERRTFSEAWRITVGAINALSDAGRDDDAEDLERDERSAINLAEYLMVRDDAERLMDELHAS